jgi:hypothetical protein
MQRALCLSGDRADLSRLTLLTTLNDVALSILVDAAVRCHVAESRKAVSRLGNAMRTRNLAVPLPLRRRRRQPLPRRGHRAGARHGLRARPRPILRTMTPPPAPRRADPPRRRRRPRNTKHAIPRTRRRRPPARPRGVRRPCRRLRRRNRPNHLDGAIEHATLPGEGVVIQDFGRLRLPASADGTLGFTFVAGRDSSRHEDMDGNHRRRGRPAGHHDALIDGLGVCEALA